MVTTPYAGINPTFKVHQQMYKLIYFFGPDGVGKTTHANLIANRLRLMGFRVWRASVKQHHTLAYLLLKTLSHRNPKGKIMNYYGFNDVLMRRIRTPWKILEIVSLFPAVFYRIILPLLLGYVVVCDRYVLDTLVTLSYFLKDPKLILSKSARILIRLIPKNSLLLYFNADAEVILQRKRCEPLTFQLITYYARMYAMMINVYNLKAEKINTTTEPINKVREKIANLIDLCENV
ncbi:MAG: hypothetical protein QXD95_07955 [Nitrososphaeria archaeon]